MANAGKKAWAYQALSQLPTLALNGGMTIVGLPPERQPGAPLDCLLSDPVSGKACSEMHPTERPAVIAYRDFVAQHLDGM
ncbi:MAG: hypothetical protein RBT75_13400 [Anaerolineae bacterium]|jgi:hypothetical protein|nr:hypothetical protein [Anaerolineae bacterium]